MISKKKLKRVGSNWAERGFLDRPICASRAGKGKKKWAGEWVPFVGDPLKTKGYAAFPAVGLKGHPTAGICLLRLIDT
jgi:hypothetical protein